MNTIFKGDVQFFLALVFQPPQKNNAVRPYLQLDVKEELALFSPFCYSPSSCEGHNCTKDSDSGGPYLTSDTSIQIEAFKTVIRYAFRPQYFYGKPQHWEQNSFSRVRKSFEKAEIFPQKNMKLFW